MREKTAHYEPDLSPILPREGDKTTAIPMRGWRSCGATAAALAQDSISIDAQPGAGNDQFRPWMSLFQTLKVIFPDPGNELSKGWNQTHSATIAGQQWLHGATKGAE